MKSLSKVHLSAAAGLLAVPLLLSGCSLLGSERAAQIDPPPSDIESQMLQASSVVNQTSTGKNADKKSDPTTVYLENGQGLLAPVSLHLPDGSKEGKLNRLLESLVQDGSYASALPDGFKGILPKGTQVTNVTLKNKVAIVEFNKEFNNYKAEDERKVLEAVTWTLTGSKDVQNVQLWVDGQQLSEMPVAHTPLSQPLNRTVGINLELTPGASVSQTSPVTVYFSAATPSGIPYFVPVTRLVPSGEDVVKSALNQLIQGPTLGDGLEQVLTSNTAIDSVNAAKDGVVTVSLTDDMFTKDQKIPSQLLQSLVLTVTENNASASKVKIWVNGSKEVLGDDDKNYSEPVSRPLALNDIPI
ncbi:germination protein M [Paenibacillus shirakamiensis]|uniref:Germination protein M n=1 Tax=Paenibacillus shirakamiensis TaxID=1265935 RepID=A0ABS4JFF1_9BACL|nr:GerMN domain-containing protein [Paenibacillus shirakamiensis]MBP2000445.1 germination protein M [Paenibacillus shirakamiensis]